MKLLLGILLVATCTFAGKKSTEKYYKSKRYFDSLLRFIRQLESNLSYKRDGVREVASAERFESDEFNDTLKNFACGQDIENQNFLSDKENGFIKDFFLKLGRGNVNAEKEFLEFSEQKTTEYVVLYSKKCADYGVLGVKIGFAAGVAAFIVII